MTITMNNLLPYLPSTILIAILVITLYQTFSSPNENQKSKLLETLQTNILRYVIPTLLIIKMYLKQKMCVLTLTLLCLSILSSFNQFSRGFRIATIIVYTGYSYNCLFCPISSQITYWFDVLLPILLILVTKMKYDRGEKIL